MVTTSLVLVVERGASNTGGPEGEPAVWFEKLEMMNGTAARAIQKCQLQRLAKTAAVSWQIVCGFYLTEFG